MPCLSSLWSRLYSIEEQFLAAMDGDDHMMDTFCDTWASLRHDIQTAEATGVLAPQLAELAHTVSARISTIAEAFQNMDDVAQQLSNEFDHELELLGDSTRSEKDEGHGLSRNASYIRPGYAWLLENLHNPYPTKEVKDLFARESGSSVKLIDGWFVDVRKRIGWSKIKREHFQNKRKPLIDAATRFFVTGGPIPANIGIEFAEMAGIARDLYSHKFCQSDLAAKLASKSPDPLPSQSQPRHPYPSPRQSPESFPLSSLESSEGDDTTNSFATSCSSGLGDIPRSNRKRARSEETPEQGPISNKRARSGSSPKDPSQLAIPSPTLPSPSPTEDTLPSTILPKDTHVLDSDCCWTSTFPATEKTTDSQTLSAPVPSSSPRRHTRKRDSPSLVVNDPSLQGNDAADAFPLPTEAATITAQMSNRLSSVQLDYTLSGVPYTLSTEVSEHVGPTEVDTMDLSLLNNDFFQNYQLSPPQNDNDNLFTVPTRFEDTAPPPVDNMDLTSLSGFFNGSLSGNQLLDSLPIPSELDSITTPPMLFDSFTDLTEVDINLSSFFSTLPTSSGRLPQSLVSDLVNTAEHSTKHPGQAKKLAQLEQLRRHGLHVQECIKSLERQIAA